VRFGIAPLYNTYWEIAEAVRTAECLLDAGLDEAPEPRSAVT